MSLADGVRAGSAFLGTMEGIQRSKQSRELREEEQAEIRRRRKEQEEIQKAGLEAMQDVAASSMTPAPVSAMPPAAAAAQQAAPAAAMEPVATATPVAPPGSGAAPSGESLTMEPVTQASPAPPAPPPYEEPRHHPPPPGSTISESEIPSMASLRTASGQPGAAAPAAPAGPQQAPSMGQARSPDDMDRINQVLMAQSRKAAELGRTDLALQYHVQGMQLRDQLRGQALDRAEQQFRTTGDVNAFVPVFNRYVANGTTIDSLTKQPDGSYALVGKTDDGKQFQQKLSPGQMQQYLQFMRDPKAARALEAKRAEDIRKSAHEIRLEQAKAAGKDRFQTVAPGATVLDTQTGGTFHNPRTSTDGAFELKTVKDADGAETLVRHNKETGQVTPLFGGVGANGRQLPKQVTAMQKDAVNAVFKAAGADSDAFAMMEDGDEKAKLTQQIEFAADLVSANYGTDNWGGMNHAKAANIARALAEGDEETARPVLIRVPGQDQPVRGVVYQGRKYLLDPNVRGSSGGGGRDRAAEKAFNSNPTVQQSAARSGQRAGDREEILNTELVNEQAKLQAARTPAERQRAQANIEAISRELGVVPPVPVPVEAPPAAPPAPGVGQQSVEQLPTPSQQRGIGTTRVQGRIS